MKRITSAAGLMAALFLVPVFPAAAMDVAPTGVTAKAKPAVTPAATPAKAKSPAAKPAVDPAASAAAAANAFGMDLFARLVAAHPNANTVISPYNIDMALNLLAQGAGAQTRAVYETALHWDGQKLSLAEGGKAVAALRTALPSGNGVTLEQANALWTAKDFSIRPAYVALAKTSFAAAAQPVDFTDAKTLPVLNGWVEASTHGKIPHLLSQLPASTQLVLVSALYVKGAWQDKFDVAATAPADFTRGDGVKVAVPMMHRTASFSYAETAAYQAIVLPFRDPHYEWVAVLPKPGSEAAVADGLKQGALSALEPSHFHALHGQLALPRLKLSWGDDILEPLKGLGFAKAFESGAVYDPLTPQPIAVSSVVHQITFEADEVGAEAAAATAVVVTRAAMVETNFEMTLDRPFYFVLREKMTGAVLFVGYVADPGTGAAK